LQSRAAGSTCIAVASGRRRSGSAVRLPSVGKKKPCRG
jgi:hypothetical protein